MRSETATHLLLVCNKPRMYLQTDHYETVCAYLDGYNTALEGAPLAGFREWLLAEGTEWTNLPWCGVVRRLIFPCADPASPLAEADGERALSALASALEGYFEDRKCGGLGAAFQKYNSWLMARTDESTAELRQRLRDKGWPE